MKEMFGYFPRQLYTNCSDPHGLRNEFTKNIKLSKIKKQTSKALAKRIKDSRVSSTNSTQFVNFLVGMMNLVFEPVDDKKVEVRKTAKELLRDEWLFGV